MANLTIVVADASRARIFTYDGLDLEERVDLVEPERRLRPQERHGDAPATGYAGTGVAYGIDDHSARHERELDRRFAASVADRLGTVAREAACRRALICASPRMLGNLRDACASLVKAGLGVDEVALDLARTPVPELHDRLAALGHLAARRRARA